MSPDEMREAAKRLRARVFVMERLGETADDERAGADALDRLAGIVERDEEVGEDEGWHIGGAWGDYGEVVVPLRILSYVIGGELDQQITSTDPGYAVTYAEQVRRAEQAERRLADVIEYVEMREWASVNGVLHIGSIRVYQTPEETVAHVGRLARGETNEKKETRE